jgi:hypothetical protein
MTCPPKEYEHLGRHEWEQFKAYMRKTIPKQQSPEMTTSSHQKAQQRYTRDVPPNLYSSTTLTTVVVIIVARPYGLSAYRLFKKSTR